MGKVSKWFRGLLSHKKPDSSSPIPTASVPKPPKEKRRWSFIKSHRENDNLPTTTAVKTGIHNNDSHAIALPTASVLRLRSGDGCVRATVESIANREEWAAVTIQAAFRGCLARRALRALKGLVKLQALVRGQVERKRTAERLQLLLRSQAQVRMGRLRSSLIAKSSNVHLHGPATPDKVENPIRSKSMKYDQSSILKRDNSKSYAQISGNKEKCWKTTESWVDEKSWNRQRSFVRTCVDEERNVRILEMDSEKGIFAPKRRARNLFHSTNLALVSDPYSQTLTSTKNSTIHHSGPIHREAHQSHSPPEGHEADETPFCTANNSPHQFFSGSSRDGSSKRSPFTPTRSDGSRSYASAYSGCPHYMAYTESSKAKVRSLSAPKQRARYERSGSSNRCPMNGFSESTLAAQRASALQASFTSKAYPGSGRLDKSGLPMGYRY